MTRQAQLMQILLVEASLADVELTLEALAEGVEESEAVDGIAWTVPRSPGLRRLPPVDPELGATATRMLHLWGREAS